MQQVNQNEQGTGAGMILFISKDRQIKYATAQGYDFSHPAPKEHCFHCATMLNGNDEVTEERDAVELVCFAIYGTELELDDGKISQEECERGCESFRWTIGSLIDSAYWCASFLVDDEERVLAMTYEKITAEEFAKRDQDINGYFEKLAA